MRRSQFTFYVSFYQAISRIRRKADRCDAYEAICAYALYGAEPDFTRLSDAATIVFSLIRPTLDTAAKKAKGGMASPGGGKDTDKIDARSGEDSGNKKEKEKENEIENETEKEIDRENEVETEKEIETEGEGIPAHRSAGASPADTVPASIALLRRRLS